MTKNVVLQEGTVLKLNTSYDLLIVGGPYRLFMGGSAAPGADSDWSWVTGPQVVPQGVGAYITAFQEGVTVSLSLFLPSGTAPADPFTVV